ncbi:MAG TPA: hypothetical protein VHT95_01975 [Vicinamibacterales bacterium]|jgi:hypothetical protein|nr:hypothetical protein [Vicinamibacterales bacterium]
MKRTAVFVLGVVALSAGAFAQAPADAIEKALSPAPRNMKEGAAVIKFKADGTYDTLKPGTNRLVCYDRSGDPGQQPFSVQCTSVANIPRVAQNRKFEAIADKAARQAAIDAAEKDGTRVKPEFGSVWLTMNAADKEHATHVHTTIAVPGATTQSLGLPSDGKQGGVWIMNAGTSTAHLMTPGS